MKKYFILFFMISTVSAFSQSHLFDTALFYRGGSLFKLFTWEDSLQINDFVYRPGGTQLWQTYGSLWIMPSPTTKLIRYPAMPTYSGISMPNTFAKVFFDKSKKTFYLYNAMNPADIIPDDTISGCQEIYTLHTNGTDAVVNIDSLANVCGCFIIKNMGLNSVLTVQSIEGYLFDTLTSIELQYGEFINICPSDSQFLTSGMTYPSPGVPISNGSAWASSIAGTNGSSLRYISNAWRAWPDSVGASQSIPTVGIPVSTGSAWSSSITGTNGSSLRYISDAWRAWPDSVGAIGTFVPNSEIISICGTGVDTMAINLTDKYLMGYSSGFTVDSIIVVMNRRAGAPYVYVRVNFGKDFSAAGTAVVTAGSYVGSFSIATKISSFENATIPTGNMIWLTFSAADVKPKSIYVILMGHRL